MPKHLNKKSEHSPSPRLQALPPGLVQNNLWNGRELTAILSPRGQSLGLPSALQLAVIDFAPAKNFTLLLFHFCSCFSLTLLKFLPLWEPKAWSMIRTQERLAQLLNVPQLLSSEQLKRKQQKGGKENRKLILLLVFSLWYHEVPPGGIPSPCLIVSLFLLPLCRLQYSEESLEEKVPLKYRCIIFSLDRSVLQDSTAALLYHKILKS